VVADPLADPRFLEGLRLARRREWFTAHDVWEELWRETDPGEPRELIQGLIQQVVALEHLQRGNPMGAFNVWNKARAKLAKLDPWCGGVGIGPWGEAIAAFYTEVNLGDRVRLLLEGGVAADELGPREGRAELPPLPGPEGWPVPPLTAELEARL